jgi:hypothetical protein
VPDTFRYEGFSSPIGTIVPDDVFDVLMPQLTDPELRVLLYIIRRTFGFKRAHDDISLKQMVEGIRTRDGRILDRGTGISKAGVARGLKGLQAKGIIVAARNSSVERGNEPTTYALRFRDDPDAPQGGPLFSSTPATPRPQIDPPPLSQSETRACLTEGTSLVSAVRHTTNRSQQTEEQGTGLETSKLRAPPCAIDPRPDNPVGDPPRGERSAVLLLDSATREQLSTFIRDLAHEFNDGATVRSSTSRLANLYRRADLPMDDFVGHLYAARVTTKERTAAIRKPARDATADGKKNKMAYFYAVLERRLGLHEPPSLPNPVFTRRHPG